MGKKQSKKPINKNSTYLSKDFDEFSLIKMAKNSSKLKDFMWKYHKQGKISNKTEAVINKFLNQITDNQNIQGQLEQKLRQSQILYLKTSQIFRGLSLKEKYSKLLQGNVQQIIPEQKEQLTNSQTQKLQKIKKFYRKYKVSSMFKDNLSKHFKAQVLDTLIGKGYLKQLIVSQQRKIVNINC